ncbi:hypothetical protein LNV09_14995 [Paucibacter sp. B2R-40]|nr:hypothetical protein [Paucibacter sp. B2R-40]
MPAQPQPQANSSCLIVFGHGRNFEPGQDDQNEAWDRLNLQFNQQVLLSLELAGRRGFSMVLKSAATDLPRNLGLLLAEAAVRGCSQVLETTLFGDEQTQTLKARLRLYPVLGAKGPRVAGADLRIGEPLYTNERDFEFTRRVLERLNPAALGQAMADESISQLMPGGIVAP